MQVLPVSQERLAEADQQEQPERPVLLEQEGLAQRVQQVLLVHPAQSAHPVQQALLEHLEQLVQLEKRAQREQLVHLE